MTNSMLWLLLEAVYHIIVSLDFASGGVSCLSNPCLNGICIDDVNSNYSCYCIDGYTGIQCQTNWDECWSAPCRNGGTCVDGIASYNCSCADGFIGDNCEVNYNECESSPCYNNATCVDLTNGYVCACPPGYSGLLCELDVAVCNATGDGELRCHNGGQCLEGPGFKYSCRCIPGWTGRRCEESIDECASSPCQNGGICIDGHADYMCACTFGHTGKSCETPIEFCADNSCSDHALCVLEEHVRVCYCVPDYHGERCQYQYDECQLGPRCMNGGTCIDGVDNFTCSCPPQLTGLLCECLLLDDGSLDCDYVSPTRSSGSFNTSITVTSTSVAYEDLTTALYDVSAYTQQPETTTIYKTKEQSTTTVGLMTDLSTIHETFSLFTESPETTTAVYSDTKFTNDFTTRITTSDTFSNRTTEVETTTILSETSTYEGVTLKIDNSITDLTSSCGNLCSEHTSSTPLASTEPTANTDITVTIPIMTSLSSTKVVETTTALTTVFTPKIVSPESTDTETTTSFASATTFGHDSTSEMLFTDGPIGLPEEVTTMPTIETEITTIFDNLTDGYTTLISDCSDSLCNERGSCVQTPHGFRCVCNFNYGGEFCEDRINITSAALAGSSYVAHKLRNDSSLHVAFIARTLITEGQVMYLDIAPGIYVQLYFNSGLLKFKFSCGYQTMLLSELKTFLNSGYNIKIDMLLDLDMGRQHCNATLRLNDTVAMSGGQLANITSLRAGYTLYLGHAPAAPAAPAASDVIGPFVGCVQDLVVNGAARHVVSDAWEAAGVRECASLPCLSAPCLNGGSCLDHERGGGGGGGGGGSHYTCACANGFMGEQCERSVCANNPCQFGGTCVRYPGSGFLCLCPFGKHGLLCEYNLDITRPSLAPTAGGVSSYVAYPLSGARSSETFDLRLRFHASDADQIALLAYVGQRGRHHAASHHLALTYVKGYVMLTWNLGSGPRRIFTPRPLSEGRASGHTVRVGRRGRSAWLAVDARYNVSGNAPGANTRMDVVPLLYIGGHPSVGFHELPHDLPLHRGWSGCVWEVGGGGVGAAAAAGRGAGQCGLAQCHSRACSSPHGVCVPHPATYGCICNEGWFGATCAARHNPCDSAHGGCRGHCVVTAAGDSQCDCPYGKTGADCREEMFPTDVLLTGVRSYVKLRARNVSSVALALQLDIRPLKPRGLLLYADTASFRTALSLQGGLLEYRWTDKTTGIVSVVRSGVVISTEQWHTVRAGRYGSRLYVWADGTIATQGMAAHTSPHTAPDTTLTLGGERDLASLPYDVMAGPPESYAGCLRNLHVNNVLLPLEQHNIQDSTHRAACGVEACGAGACRVVEGRAACACGAGAAGARCRRHVPCGAAACTPPRGRCRGDVCVCATGYAGPNCTQAINITTPQFSGDSLLEIDAGAARGELRERGETQPRGVDFVALNFTTAEPEGLLVWAQYEHGFTGVGLEDGFLKILWSAANESQPQLGLEAGAGVGRLVRARTLADAEWHRLELRLGADKLTVSVDGRVVHVQQSGPGPGARAHIRRVYVGGVSDDVAPAAAWFGRSFRGCVDHIATARTGLLRDYSLLYSENVRSCQLLP